MQIVTVNEADTVIGSKERENLASTDIYRVARLIILNSRGQVLMAQRALIKKKDPGVWGLAVEGTVEEGEDYESNIRKEAQEEIGVTLGVLNLGPRLRMTGTYNHHCQFFVFHADLDASALHLQEEELAAVQWFTPQALKQEVAEQPQKFGYNFSLILETIWPILQAKH
ncbi:MAG TPA: NUDIX domain-containing protein [Bacillota bacterium]|nr:NUDIX domain-containing protein [Bacillota bacterium]